MNFINSAILEMENLNKKKKKKDLNFYLEIHFLVT